MIVLDIFLALVVLVVIGGVIVSANFRTAIRAKTGGHPQLTRAARLLERVAASDDVMPQLPATLREEIDGFLAQHYKEHSK